MKSINHITLLGRLGKDPEHATTSTGKERVTFSLATSYSVRVDDGWNEHTDWHRVVAFDWLAKKANDRLRKGDPVVVVGRMSSNKWQDADGKNRTSWSVVARELSFLSSRGEGAQRSSASDFAPAGLALPPSVPDTDTAEDADVPF